MTDVIPAHKRRILIIDDNDAIHRDFRKTLASESAAASLASEEAILFGSSAPARPRIEYEIDSALQGRDGHQRVVDAVRNGNPYHLAFVDMRMPPGWDGVETIQNLWAADPNIQVVICSAYSDYSWEQIVEKLGSTDRLLILKKPFDDVEVSQLATALTEKWLVTQQARLKLAEMQKLVDERTAMLRDAALHDHLTGLPNRQLLIDRLDRIIVQSSRDPARKFGLLFLDFDRFKVVNDSLGHEIGDLLLVGIAERLRSTLRAGDTISANDMNSTAARLGGDEFIVLLGELRNSHDAARVAERLLEVLAHPYDLKGHLVHSTASIGVTTSDVGYTCAADMIRDADTAMYRAKAAGKARYVLFDQRMHDEAITRLTIENELRHAIEVGDLFLQYQPIVCLATGKTTCFEALVRWKHPVRGIIPPAEFIPLAEETGMITALGTWVLNAACRQLAQWFERQPSMRGLSMSVNLSRRQLAAPELLSQVSGVLASSGLPASALKLEITESAIMDDAANAIRVLEQIHQLGVELHMDDFGTGYSSLSCLHRFPLSCLKIDREFVNNVGERRDYAAVVNAIIALAHNLGILLVAEGVETAEQLAMLQSLHCDHAQGYYFSRPMNADDAESFALRQRANAA